MLHGNFAERTAVQKMAVLTALLTPPAAIAQDESSIEPPEKLHGLGPRFTQQQLDRWAREAAIANELAAKPWLTHYAFDFLENYSTYTKKASRETGPTFELERMQTLGITKLQEGLRAAKHRFGGTADQGIGESLIKDYVPYFPGATFDALQQRNPFEIRRNIGAADANEFLRPKAAPTSLAPALVGLWEVDPKAKELHRLVGERYFEFKLDTPTEDLLQLPQVRRDLENYQQNIQLFQIRDELMELKLKEQALKRQIDELPQQQTEEKREILDQIDYLSKQVEEVRRSNRALLATATQKFTKIGEDLAESNRQLHGAIRSGAIKLDVLIALQAPELIPFLDDPEELKSEADKLFKERADVQRAYAIAAEFDAVGSALAGVASLIDPQAGAAIGAMVNLGTTVSIAAAVPSVSTITNAVGAAAGVLSLVFGSEDIGAVRHEQVMEGLSKVNENIIKVYEEIRTLHKNMMTGFEVTIESLRYLEGISRDIWKQVYVMNAELVLTASDVDALSQQISDSTGERRASVQEDWELEVQDARRQFDVLTRDLGQRTVGSIGAENSRAVLSMVISHATEVPWEPALTSAALQLPDRRGRIEALNAVLDFRQPEYAIGLIERVLAEDFEIAQRVYQRHMQNIEEPVLWKSRGAGKGTFFAGNPQVYREGAELLLELLNDDEWNEQFAQPTSEELGRLLNAGRQIEATAQFMTNPVVLQAVTAEYFRAAEDLRDQFVSFAEEQAILATTGFPSGLRPLTFFSQQEPAYRHTSNYGHSMDLIAVSAAPNKPELKGAGSVLGISGQEARPLTVDLGLFVFDGTASIAARIASGDALLVSGEVNKPTVEYVAAEREIRTEFVSRNVRGVGNPGVPGAVFGTETHRVIGVPTVKFSLVDPIHKVILGQCSVSFSEGVHIKNRLFKGAMHGFPGEYAASYEKELRETPYREWREAVKKSPPEDDFSVDYGAKLQAKWKATAPAVQEGVELVSRILSQLLEDEKISCVTFETQKKAVSSFEAKTKLVENIRTVVKGITQDTGDLQVVIFQEDGAGTRVTTPEVVTDKLPWHNSESSNQTISLALETDAADFEYRFSSADLPDKNDNPQATSVPMEVQKLEEAQARITTRTAVQVARPGTEMNLALKRMGAAKQVLQTLLSISIPDYDQQMLASPEGSSVREAEGLILAIQRLPDESLIRNQLLVDSMLEVPIPVSIRGYSERVSEQFGEFSQQLAAWAKVHDAKVDIAFGGQGLRQIIFNLENQSR